MNDLSNATFIMPLRIESQDRLRNIILSLSYLLNNFKTNVIIQEVDTDSKFQQYAAPELEKLVPDLSPITLLFEESEEPIFHRTRILNDMLLESTTDVVVNYDTDVIFPINSYLQAYNMVLNQGYDLVYPYGQGEWQQKVQLYPELMSKFIESGYKWKVLSEGEHNEQSTSDHGWAQFFNRKSYIEGGMENEEFVSYGYEDNERVYRFETLGYKVGRVDDQIFHLEHARTFNSWFSNPHIGNNKDLYEKIKTLNKEKLKDYYSTVDYIKNRNGKE